MLFLSRLDVEAHLSIPRMLDALTDAFRAYSAGEMSMPPRTAAVSAGGLIGAMPAFVPGAGLSIKAVTVFPGNAPGRPSHQGLIVLFDEHDGAPLCVMDGAHITAMRTGGGSAVATRLLARGEARVLAIVGAGVQGHSHLASVPLTRDFDVIRIASRTREHANALAARDARCTVADSFEDAVRDADVVCLCTDTREPVIQRSWLSPGTHVTSVGGTFGPELDPETVRSSKVFVEWRGAATNPPPAGARELQEADPTELTELGEVIAGKRSGRRSADDITLYKSTGAAFEDAVVARLVYDAAISADAGVQIDL